MGNYFGMSDDFFGAWIALSIHDTASVLGAALSFGNESVDIATTIKLTRTLWLIPLILVVSIIYDKKTTFKIPIFVLTFIFVLFLNSHLDINNMTLCILIMQAIFFYLLDFFVLEHQ